MAATGGPLLGSTPVLQSGGLALAGTAASSSPISDCREQTAARAAARGFLGGFLAVGCRTIEVRSCASIPFDGGARFHSAICRGGSRFRGAGRGSSPPRGCLLRVLVPIGLDCSVLGAQTWISKLEKRIQEKQEEPLNRVDVFEARNWIHFINHYVMRVIQFSSGPLKFTIGWIDRIDRTIRQHLIKQGMLTKRGMATNLLYI